MCGICGFTGKPNRHLIKKMTQTLVHRGPDEEGFYVDENVSLGMRRLSIIDLVAGQQPMTNEDRTIWIVFNGEIYNFLELRKELGERGHQFSTKSDTETIIHLYEEYGLEFPNQLNGMFAIALWDNREKQLVLVRDRLGVKPLYYTIFNKDIIFGSELKSFLLFPNLKKEIDYESLSHYLSLRHIPSPKTIFQNVFCLRPGEMAVFKNGHLSLKRYWRLQYQERQWKNERELIEIIYNLLKDAVLLRMRSDVPVGAYLSGGVDSSLIVALMTQSYPGKIQTFSLTYADNPSHKKDRYYAQIVSRLYGTKHYEYIMSAKEIPQEITAIVRHFDEPFSGVISSFFLTKLVKDHVKVALSGDGADDQFGSYGHHRIVWPIENYLRAIKNGENIDLVDFRPMENNKELIKKLAKMKPWQRRLQWGAFTPDQKIKLISEKFKEAVLAYKTENLVKEFYVNSTASDPLNRFLDIDINTLLPDEVLTYVDRLSMAHSVEIRSPFLDYRLVELVATIPGRWKIKDGILKYILKKVAARHVPKEILDRPKEGFVLPINTWLNKLPLKKFIREKLSPANLKKHGFFNQAYVEKLINEHLLEKEDHTYRLWTLLMFQLWYETYMLNG